MRAKPHHQSTDLAMLPALSPAPAISDPDPLDLRYPGGKGLAGLQQWICANLPPHVYYWEPFAGKAGVFRMKTPALVSTLIDRDQQTVEWLKSHIERWDPRGPSRIGVSDDGRSIIATADDFRGHRQGQRCSTAIDQRFWIKRLTGLRIWICSTFQPVDAVALNDSNVLGMLNAESKVSSSLAGSADGGLL